MSEELARGDAAPCGNRTAAESRCSRRGPDGEELCIDFAVIRSEEDDEEPPAPTAVFVHSSGVHGPEGYVGSAIQRDFLTNYAARVADQPLRSGQLAVFIHAVNPHGMAWRVRFNPNNVDLNRNSIVVPGTPSGDSGRFADLIANPNEDYVAFSPLINPDGIGPCDCFYLRAAGMIAWYGLGRLKQAAVGGQYTFPRGLYFGGQALQEEGAAVMRVLQGLGVSRSNAALTRLVHVDVHSGLGPRGVDTLLLDGGQPEQLARGIAGFAGEDKVPGVALDQLRVQGDSSGGEGVAYVTSGSFTAGVQLLAGPQLADLVHDLVPVQPQCSGYELYAEARAAAGVGSAQEEADVRALLKPAGKGVSVPSARARSPARSAKGKAVQTGAVVPRGKYEPGRVLKLAVTQEFGTLQPIEVFSAIRTLNAALAADPALPVDAPERQGSLGAFYVDTPEWKASTLERGRDVLARFWAAAVLPEAEVLAMTA